MSCKKYLQEPFVFTSCDTLVKEQIPSPKYNWMGFSNIKNLSLYRTLQINKQNIHQIYEKNKMKLGNNKAYIGLAGIKDYQDFWAAMEYGNQNAIIQ